jgi:hypothetical protein
MANSGIMREFYEFMKIRKKFWLLPIVVLMALMGALIVFTESSVVAPFIYAIF